MTRSVTVTTQVSPRLKAKLAALARGRKLSEAQLAKEAIASYVAVDEWQRNLIKKRLAEARAGAPTVPHEEVERWLASKGTANELPMPRGRGRP